MFCFCNAAKIMHFGNKTNNLSSLFLLIISLNSFNPHSLLKGVKTKCGFVIFCSGGGSNV